MPPSPPDAIYTAVLGGVVILLLASLLAAWTWALSRLARGVPLLAGAFILPLRPARWGGGTVSAMIALYLGVNIVVGQMLGPALGLKVPVPPQQKAAGPPASKDSEQEVERQGGSTEREDEPLPPESSLVLMLLHAFASVLFVLALPAVLRRTAGVGISELGLSRVGWAKQARAGIVAALLATPAVYAIHILAAGIWKTNEHPVERMMTDRLTSGTALLAFVSTVFLAPLVEETMFRGVLLGWLTRVFSPPTPVAEPAQPESEAPGLAANDGGDRDAGARPIRSGSAHVDAVATTPTVNAVCAPAVVLTSLLFAGLHAPQWPAPIGIFFLSIILGVLYQRTGSLLTVMVMHGVFNGCSTLLFLVGTLARSLQDPSNGPEVIPQLEPAARAFIDLLVRL